MFFSTQSFISLLIYLSLVSFINCHFQPSIQQVYQQQPQHQQPQHQQQVPIQNQYQQPAGQPQYHVQQPNLQQQPGVQPNVHPQAGSHHQMASNNILHDQSRIHDKEHLKEHLGAVLNEPDLNKMTEDELQFYYFKIHDSDANNKLDGSELVKSLIHWHIEENKQLGANAHPHGTTKIFTDEELAQMIDPILESDDINKDGYVDYSEFLSAQKSRGF